MQGLSQPVEIAAVAQDEARLKSRGRDGGNKLVEWMIGESMDDVFELGLDVAEEIEPRKTQGHNV